MVKRATERHATESRRENALLAIVGNENRTASNASDIFSYAVTYSGILGHIKLVRGRFDRSLHNFTSGGAFGPSGGESFSLLVPIHFQDSLTGPIDCDLFIEYEQGRN